ncbi:hypothetical protein L6R50_10810 [Myxococcota bacterium]|nr:hypothetical protein [Myxococcota bacterium]
MFRHDSSPSFATSALALLIFTLLPATGRAETLTQRLIGVGENMSLRFIAAGDAAIQAQVVLMDVAGLAEQSAEIRARLRNLEGQEDPVERASITAEILSDSTALAQQTRTAILARDALDDQEKEQLRRAHGLFFWAGLNIAAIGLDIASGIFKKGTLTISLSDLLNMKRWKRVDQVMKKVNQHAREFENTKKENDEIMEAIYQHHKVDPPNLAAVSASDKQPSL